MIAISVSRLKKYYRVHKRSAGFFAALGSLFRRDYKQIKAVDDISFEINQGELVGFIGPNGAGKTTTLKCLSGLLYPSAGKISVLSYRPFDRKEKFLKNISLVMGQKNQLWWNLPAMDTFLLNKEIYEIKESDFQEILDQLLSLLKVKKLVDIPVRHLSLGERMKMELIASLLHRPKVLFLDEPTIGLDVVMQKKMRDFIAEYNKRFAATIILTSHYMSDVKKLCRRVIIINQGRLVYDGNLEKLVEKYAATKMISVEVKGPILKEEFAKFGKIRSVEQNKIVISVPKKLAKKAATVILEKYQVLDLNIEDPEIEEVIRLVFNKKQR